MHLEDETTRPGFVTLPKSSRSERSKSRERPQSRFLALLVALPVICLTIGCSSPDSTPPEVSRPVKTMVVRAGNELSVHSFPGRVQASKKVQLEFLVPGRIAVLRFIEGQKVAKGEIIAQLRQDEFQARLTTAQGQLDQARASLDALRLGERPEEQLRRRTQERATAAKLANARSQFERYKQLVQLGAVSRSEYDEMETAYRVAEEEHKGAVQLLQQGTVARKEDIDAQEAVVRGLDGRVADAKLQLEDSTLRAPYDGVIAQRFVERGQSIPASSRWLGSRALTQSTSL